MQEIVKILTQLRSTTKTSEKANILKQNKDNELLKKVLYYTYGDKQFGFSEKKLTELYANYETKFILTWKDGFEMLDTLAASNINDKLREEVLEFLSILPTEEIRDVWFKILIKDLACGISVKTIEKIFPKLLPKWEVMRPTSMDGLSIKEGVKFGLSLKANGCRGTYYKHQIKSRQNEIILGLEHIVNDIKKLQKINPEFENYVFDGELIRNNIDRVDDNKNLMLTNSILKNEKSNKQEIIFVLFDCLPETEFEQGSSKDNYFKRKEKLLQIQSVIEEYNLSSLKVIEFLYEGCDQSKIQEILNKVDAQGLEGLILNLDKPYVCKKTKNVLKVKQFKEADVKIVGWFLGKSGANLGKFGGFTVDYKGTHTNIGGGYTKADREYFQEHADEYIGRVMQIKFKDETVNSVTGKVNIQFGNYVRVREKGKEISYN